MITHYRTHWISELPDLKAPQPVTLCGWVHKVRNLGGLVFCDLRDRTGLLQLVWESQSATLALAEQLRSEFVIQVTGSLRQKEQPNKLLLTGHLELVVDSLNILNKALPPVIDIAGDAPSDEITRLKYRYLDLRKPAQFSRFKLRHSVTKALRDHLNKNGFLEVETPILTKSTPEGARDYVVPSRVQPGKWFALPQSPQLFKQLLMMSGFERYYQVVKCFRDEDLRADRQPEFTQVDIEASFVTQADIMNFVNGLIEEAFKAANLAFPSQIPVLTYAQAMALYGSDKPDLRVDMEFADVSSLVAQSSFNVFAQCVQNKGLVKAFCIPKSAEKISRKVIDDWTAYAKTQGANGLAYMHLTAEGVQSPISKFFDDTLLKQLITKIGATVGDTLVFVAHENHQVVHTVLGALRLKIAADLQLFRNEYKLLWVVDFPLFEWSETDQRWASMHHPFTSPHPNDVEKISSDPGAVRAQAYDLVLNGSEIGGGSIRIHNLEQQNTVFSLLGLSPETIQNKFGFFIDALGFGTPPHGGIALGLDRLVAILAQVASIRDVIAFPKTQSASCPLTNAPSEIEAEQLKELGLINHV